jgi:hypothetical protein
LVIEEDQRLSENTATQIRKAREEWLEETEVKKKELIEKGLDPDREEILHLTAAELERRHKKSKLKEDLKLDDNFGWESKFFRYG